MFEGEAICFILYSSPKLLYSVNVFFQTRTQAGPYCHDDVHSVGLLIQDRLISVMELELAEAGKPVHLAY